MHIKICGVTRIEDAQLAADAGADSIGLNFYPGSPRRVTVEQAIAIVAAVPTGPKFIGVFVGDAEVDAIARRVGLHGVQQFAEANRSRHAHHVTAYRVAQPSDIAAVHHHLALVPMPWRILIDSHVPGQFGGTGHVAPWELLAGHDWPVPLVLAGGLTPANVAEAVRIVRPHTVDVASGVESAPGIKDVEKLRAFIAAVQCEG